MPSSYNISELGNPNAKSEVIDIAAAANPGTTTGLQCVEHGEFNEKGDEIWFSVWTGNKTEALAIVLIDEKTRKVREVIKDPHLVTPTGKFKVCQVGIGGFGPRFFGMRYSVLTKTYGSRHE